MSKVKALFSRIAAFIGSHKIISAVIGLVLVGGGYYAYTNIAAQNTPVQYTLSPVFQAPLQVTVKGSGQVSAQNTLNLTPQASGQLTYLGVMPGQSVHAGSLIAQLDMTSAAQSVTTARQNLLAAKIAYTQAQTTSQSSVSSDQTAVSTAQTNESTAIITAYTGLPAIVNGLDTTLHTLSTISGYTDEQNLDAYSNYINSAQAHIYHDQVATAYSNAVSSYQSAQAQYGANSSSSGPAMDALIQTLIKTVGDINTAVRSTLSYLNYINDQVVAGKMALPTQLTTQIASLNTYQATLTTDTTNLITAQTALTNAQQTLTRDTQSLGATTVPLDVQTAQLNVQKAQVSLDQALTAESYDILRAPFDGTIATVPAHKFDQVSNGTTIATLITTQDYADLSLNETDAAKVQIDQQVSMTFPALPGVTATGKVAILNPLGTVVQGVVTYDVKISFDSVNSAVKPGMTVNAVITTATRDTALQVPSSAVKTVNGLSTVQVATLTNASSTTDLNAGGQSARQSNGGTGGRFRNASSTTATSTSQRVQRQFSVPSSRVTLTTVPVTTGLYTDTITEITNGLTQGQLVVTGTQSGAKKSTSSTPTATSLLGGGNNNTVRRATNGAVRGN